jgi:hypothetical protein
MNIGPKQNKSCYVYTNPAKDTELFSCDKVYVLSPKPLLKSSKRGVLLAEKAMDRRTMGAVTSNFDLQLQVEKVQSTLDGRVRDVQMTVDNYIQAVGSLTQAQNPSMLEMDN